MNKIDRARGLSFRPGESGRALAAQKYDAASATAFPLSLSALQLSLLPIALEAEKRWTAQGGEAGVVKKW